MWQSVCGQVFSGILLRGCSRFCSRWEWRFSGNLYVGMCIKEFCFIVERFWSNSEWRSCCNLYVGISIQESCFISERFWSSWAWRFSGNLYVGMCIQRILLHSLRDFRAVESEGFGAIYMWVGELKNSASDLSDVSSSSNSRREDCEASGSWFQQICKVTSAIWWLSGVRYRSSHRHREQINISILGATSERDVIGSLVAGGIRSVSYGVCMSMLPEASGGGLGAGSNP